MRIIHANKLTTLLLTLTLLSGAVLASSAVSADNDSVVDEINITVPVSCTMSGTGMTSHDAEINNGTYQADIGTTTMHAFCNDSEGFAIYAAGYTGDEIGGTNSNKLVGTAASNNAVIESGTATTAGNPDVSNWAMKLAISQDSGDTTGTNAFTIDSAPNVDLPSQAEQSATSAPFSNYHVVPNEYTKVAHKDSNTDMTATTGGVKLTTTYAAYISKTQPADTYSGQVIYTLVHPSSADVPVPPDQIGVNFYGNGLTFAGGATKNRVIYANECSVDGYIATTPEIVETSNLTNGVQDGSYTNSEVVYQIKTFTGADRIKVVVDYGVTGNTGGIGIVEGIWDGDWNNYPEVYYMIQPIDNESGTEEYIINGDTTTIYIGSYGTPESGHDYGFYTRIYPIYNTEQEGTEALSTTCSCTAQAGIYAQTTTWDGKWYFTDNGKVTFLENEAAVIDYITQNESTLLGTTIDLYAYNHSCNPTAVNISQMRCMQDFASLTDEARDSALSSMNRGTQYILRDSRDDTIYTVAKLADGNVWMTQNLDLDLDSTRIYTNADTDIGYNATTRQYTTASWTPMNSTYPTTTDHIRNWNNSFTQPDSYDPGDLYWNGTESNPTNWTSYGESCHYSGTAWVCNQSINPTSNYVSTTGIPQYHLGNYYNWTAAVAMNDSASVETGKIVGQSICPAGWTLPLPGEGEDTFYALWYQYGFLRYPYEVNGNNQRVEGGNGLWQSPFYLIPSGYYGRIPSNIGYAGLFWTQAKLEGDATTSAGYKLSGDPASFPSTYNYSSASSSIRCIARPVVNTVTNLPEYHAAYS